MLGYPLKVSATKMTNSTNDKTTKELSEKEAIQATVSRLFKQYDKAFKHLST